VKRTISGAAIVVLLTFANACTSKSSSAKLPAGTVLFDCSAPIGELPSPTTPQTSILDAIALDTTSTMQVNDSGFPHSLFAKTPLIVHAEHDAIVTIPADWAARVSIAWGNHAAVWTTSLHIPACAKDPTGTGDWFVFPGGFSLDSAACVPVDIRSGNKTTTVHVSVGARCPDA
jgi:hypothetical protein